ncbi:MAG TPA: hypothetical protein VIR31_03300 [Nitrososphaeraceae archaeon]
MTHILNFSRQTDRFDKLITALRTAVDNDGVLDKEPHYTMIYSMHLGWQSFIVIKIVAVNVID